MRPIRWIMVKEDCAPYFVSDAAGVTAFAQDVLKLHEKDREHFVVLLLNTKTEIIGYETVSIGILDGSLVHPREVFKPAVAASAHRIILLHNHPSGDPTPSAEDKKVTEELKKCGDIMKISIADHVIMGTKRYYSFEEGGGTNERSDR